jgi:hypothetical protein
VMAAAMAESHAKAGVIESPKAPTVAETSGVGTATAVAGDCMQHVGTSLPPNQGVGEEEGEMPW